jgi:hypothetical protein
MINETQVINSIKIPKKLEKITQTPVSKTFPTQEIFFYRNLLESRPIDKCFRDKISVSIFNKDQWFNKRKVEFGTSEIHKKELEENNKIQRRILEERQILESKIEYTQLKQKLDLRIIFELCKKNDLGTIIFNLDEYIANQERRKIIEDRNFRKFPINFNLKGTLEEILATIADDTTTSNKANIAGTLLTNRKKHSINMKAIQEINFINCYFLSELGKEAFGQFLFSDLGRDFASRYPTLSQIEAEKKKSEFKINKNFGKESNHNKSIIIEKSNKNQSDNYVEDLRLSYNIDTLLAKMKISPDLNVEEFDIKQQSPIVYLENEKFQHKTPGPSVSSQNIINQRSKSKKKILPSIHKIKIQTSKEKEEKGKNDAEVWHNMKSYRYSYDGKSPRSNNPLVPNYLRSSFPEAVFNEDYICVEKLTEKRLKTSSVANRLYFNAPSVNEIRKSGQHNFIEKALDKKKTYDEMMERLNLMITSELVDPLNRMLKIDPVELNFGYIKIGTKYEMMLKIRNDDDMTNRIQIVKNLNNKWINIESFIGGKICAGELKKVKVTIEADIQLIGNFAEIIEIQTKSFIYKIPVTAMVISPEEFERLNAVSLIKNGGRLQTFAQIYKKEVIIINILEPTFD